MSVKSKPCKLPGTGNLHLMHVHCVQCNAYRMCKMTPDTVEGWYHYGNLSQTEYEAYMHAWATSTSTARYTAGGWAALPTDPSVLTVVDAIRHYFKCRTQSGPH